MSINTMNKILVAAAVVALLVTTFSEASVAQETMGADNERLEAEVVMEWNWAMLTMIKEKNISNQFGNRTMAMVHIAMFDAINGINPEYTPFFVREMAPRSISPQAAAAAAAHKILSSLYPAEQETFDSIYREQLSRLPVNPGLGRLSEKYGEQIANAVLEWRENDWAAQAASVPYPDGTRLGEWRRTSMMSPMLPGWGQVVPFAMTTGDQFRLTGPPPLDSYEYARDYNEVKTIGEKYSALRTTEQAEIALFWPAGIPRMWNLVARQVVEQHQYGLIESARLFALLTATLADANVMAWDMKYHYGYWRPVTAIHYGDVVKIYKITLTICVLSIFLGGILLFSDVGFSQTIIAFGDSLT